MTLKTEERPIFSPAEIAELAGKLLEMGFPARVVRRRLADQGISWRYQYAGQGRRERLRRLHRQGQGLCSICHKRPYSLETASVNVCRECLDEKWQRAR